MRRNRRLAEDTNISFLDVICCGFGAIILLLVIVKSNQPVVLEESPINLDGQVKALQKRLFTIRGEIDYLEKDLNARHEQLDVQKQRVAILRSEFDVLNSQRAAVSDADASLSTQKLDLQIALQTLTKEMKRLISGRSSLNNYVGGIPVDSEYIIFIIDTSGSMFIVAWNRMIKEMVNILNIYPKVKGIQVMNDMGKYMFTTYRGEWIPDTPSRRKAIIDRLRNWNAFSNSSPVEGINAAIRSFYSKDKKISLYVMGDDYSGRSLSRVLEVVNSLNKKNKRGDSLVRIHAVGFPVQFLQRLNVNGSGVRYAALMRELAEQNNGTFIGLNNVR